MNASATRAVWQRHNRRLLAVAATSILAALGLWLAAPSPDGRDPFYVALAIEFVIWGVIDAWFAIAGSREIAAIDRLGEPERDEALAHKYRTLRRLLRVNNWLNILWLATGAGLMAWGYGAWSPSLAGHGVGVLVQAIALTVLDLGFAAALRDDATVTAAVRPRPGMS